MKLLNWSLLLCLIGSAQCFSQPMIHLVSENWAPQNYIDKGGKIGGKAVDKIHQIFAIANLKYDINIYPWARSYHLALTEPNTAVFSIMRSQQREKLFQWVCPLLTQGTLYFIRLSKRKDIILNQLTDVKSYSLSVSRNEFDHQYLLQHGFKEGVNFDLTTGDKVNIKLLLSGRADLIVATKRTIHHYLKSLNKSADEITTTLPLSSNEANPLCLAFSLKTPKATVDKVRAALKQVILRTTPKKE